MNDLSPEARKLLDGARLAGGPTAAQRVAMKQAVLGSAAAPVAAAAPAVKSALLAKLGVGVMVVAVGGAVVFKLSTPEVVAQPRVEAVRSPSEAEGRVEVVAPVEEPTMVPPPVVVAPVPERSRGPIAKKPVPEPVVVAEAPPAPPKPPVVDEETLAKEVAAVSGAMQTVQNGNYDQALTEIEVYQDDYPGGALQVEASVVKVLALCGLKRLDEARAIAATVPASNPAARRLERSCVR